MEIRDTWHFARLKPLPRQTVVLGILCICFVVIFHTMKDANIGRERLLLHSTYSAIEQNETANLFGRSIINRSSSTSENHSVFGEIKAGGDAAEINYISLWNSLDAMIGNGELYSDNFDVTIATNALRHAKIVAVDRFLRRTSFKWIITLEGGQKVLFKPAVVNNTERQSLCNKGCEHPEYEVAGFTVNRLLGYRNFPFTTGRVLNWSKEVLPVATQRLKDFMTITEGGDVCVRVRCFRLQQPIYKCFKDGMVPGAMIYFLRREVFFRSEPGRNFHHYYPTVEYKQKPRPYMLKLPGDDSYCKTFRQMDPYKRPRDFGDILDITVISYITNHRDQKLTVIQTGSSYMHVMFDYGFSFCPNYNIILAAPIYQCCSIRRRSFERLHMLKDTLPSEFEEMTKDDPLYPLLEPSQLELLTNRVKMLLALTDYCINSKGFDNVVKDFV